MTFQPIGKNILLKILKEEQQKQKGILILENINKKQERAQVIALGSGRTNDQGQIIPFVVKENDIVIYRNYGGYELQIENEDHIILTEDNIIAIIK